MKKFSEKDFSHIEDNIYLVGIELSKITSLINFLDIALNDELEVNEIDLANLTVLLKEKIYEVNERYNKIEMLLGV